MASAFLDRVSNKAIGELLVDKGAVTKEQVDEALLVAKKDNIRLGEALISLGYISRDSLGYAIGEQYGMQPVDLQPSMVDLDLVSRFDYELLSEHTMLPLIELDNELVVVVGDPNEQKGLAAMARLMPDHQITPQLGATEQIRRCLDAVHAHRLRPSSEVSAHSASATLENLDLSPRGVQHFSTPPAPESDEFLEWIISQAAAHPGRDVLIREIGDEMQVSLTPAPSTASDPSTGETTLTELGRWPGAGTTALRHAVAVRAIPVEHTRGQAARWVYPGIEGSHTYDFMVLMPVSQGASVIRVRANCHITGSQSDERSQPLSLSLKAGHYTVVLYDDMATLEQALALFVAENMAAHQIIISQQATRCSIAGAQAYPAPFTNMVPAAQAHAATCVIFDHPVEYREATRLLTCAYPPPAVIICAAISADANGFDSGGSSEIEELVSHLGANCVRLRKQNTEIQPVYTARGND